MPDYWEEVSKKVVERKQSLEEFELLKDTRRQNLERLSYRLEYEVCLRKDLDIGAITKILYGNPMTDGVAKSDDNIVEL